MWRLGRSQEGLGVMERAWRAFSDSRSINSCCYGASVSRLQKWILLAVSNLPRVLAFVFSIHDVALSYVARTESLTCAR